MLPSQLQVIVIRMSRVISSARQMAHFVSVKTDVSASRSLPRQQPAEMNKSLSRRRPGDTCSTKDSPFIENSRGESGKAARIHLVSMGRTAKHGRQWSLVAKSISKSPGPVLAPGIARGVSRVKHELSCSHLAVTDTPPTASMQ